MSPPHMPQLTVRRSRRPKAAAELRALASRPETPRRCRRIFVSWATKLGTDSEMRTLITFVTALAATGASAQYKCVDAAGKTSFQQTPCSPEQRASKIEIRQAPTSAPATATVVPTDRTKQPKTVEQRMIAKLEKERRIKELEDRIAGLDNQIVRRSEQMDIDIQRLRATKSYAKNNLAGATWEQSRLYAVPCGT